MPIGRLENPTLAKDLLDVLDVLAGGVHAGFRPAHAKGAMCTGTFAPSPDARTLTRAPHAAAPSTPVTVRFSDATGLPTVADNDPAQSGPRGIAVRFHLGDHVHTDVIAHSANGFPARTGDEFVTFLRAAAEAGGGKPQALDAFLASHPNAKRFVALPKPIPTSFAREAFFAITAFAFTNADGVTRHGRFRIRPPAGTAYLTNEEAKARSQRFLFDELGTRLAKEPFELRVFVQLANPEDDPRDASTPWPETRTEVEFGTLRVTARVDDQSPERRKIIFDPDPRVDGIASAGDPLTQARADVYLMSGRRRRAAVGDDRR